MHRQGNTASMVYPQIHNFVDSVGITKQSAFQNLGTGASLDPGTAGGAFCTYSKKEVGYIGTCSYYEPSEHILTHRK